MRATRTGVILSQDPVTTAQFIAPFVRLKRLMDVGAIDADNFLVSGNHYSSAYITEIADMPSRSKYFQGHFFDKGDSGTSKALDFLENHLTMIGKIGDEEIVYTLDVQIVHKEDETMIKSTEAEDEFGWKDAGIMIGTTAVTGPIGWVLFGGAFKNGGIDGVKDVARFIGDLPGKVADVASDAWDEVTSWFGRKKKKKKKKIEIAAKDTIFIPIPDGYSFVEASHYGSIFASITSKRVKILFNKIKETTEVMMFEPMLIADGKIATDEAYGYYGKLSIKLKRKV